MLLARHLLSPGENILEQARTRLCQSRVNHISSLEGRDEREITTNQFQRRVQQHVTTRLAYLAKLLKQSAARKLAKTRRNNHVTWQCCTHRSDSQHGNLSQEATHHLRAASLTVKRLDDKLAVLVSQGDDAYMC